MENNSDDVPPPGDATNTDGPVGPAPPMGRSFWLVMAMIGILVVLILIFQFQGTSQKAPAALAGTNWTLVQYADMNGTLRQVAIAEPPTAMFMAGANVSGVSGSAGCNRFTGEYTRNGSQIAVSALATTRMFCGTPGVMDLESAYLSDLQNAASYRSNPGYLVVSDNAGDTLLVFKQE